MAHLAWKTSQTDHRINQPQKAWSLEAAIQCLCSTFPVAQILSHCRKISMWQKTRLCLRATLAERMLLHPLLPWINPRERLNCRGLEVTCPTLGPMTAVREISRLAGSRSEIQPEGTWLLHLRQESWGQSSWPDDQHYTAGREQRTRSEAFERLVFIFSILPLPPFLATSYWNLMDSCLTRKDI